jgi:hypothetical protein
LLAGRGSAAIYEDAATFGAPAPQPLINARCEMATFVATTASNGARVKDADAAQRVLDRYVWDGGVEAVIRNDERDGTSRLCVYGTDWPAVWKLPTADYWNGFELDYDVDTGEIFEEFLRDIAPFLAEPLTVQTVGTEHCRFPISACEWHVLPGATTIEVAGFKHSHTKKAGDE